MIFQSPGPIIYEIGPLTLRWYGLLTVSGFLVALAFAQKFIRAQVTELVSEDDLNDFAITALVFGVIGARLWFVFLNMNYYSGHPDEIAQIWLGGQSIQGGMIGAAIGTYCFSHKNFLLKLGILACVAPLGQAIGRWGNFFNEEAFGRITELPWKLYISHTANYHHPTFLYESIWNLLCFVLLYRFNQSLINDPLKNAESPVKTKPSNHGLKLIGAYLILYSIGRLMIEALRTDSLYLLGLPAASLMSMIGIGIGLGLMIQSQKKT